GLAAFAGGRLGLGLAPGFGALPGQAPRRHRQAANQQRLQQHPDQQRIEGVDQPAAELERRVVVTGEQGHHQQQRQQHHQAAEQLAQRRGPVAARTEEGQADQQPGEQGEAGEQQDHAQHVLIEQHRLVLGEGHHAHQQKQRQTQPAHLPVQERHLIRRPAEMPLGHAAAAQDPVGGVEHQPGPGHGEQRGAQVGVLATAVELQRVAAQRQHQAAGQGLQQVEEQGQRRVPLAVALHHADVLVQRPQLALPQLAPAYQDGAEQQRQEHPGALRQAADQRADGAAPVQTGDLLDQAGWHAPPPVQAQGWVAGNPEQLLLQGAAQATGQLAQLALVELQADRLAEQGVEFAGQPAVQLVAAGQQLQQRLAQGGVGAFAAVGQKLLDRGLGVGQLLAALAQLELVKADIGDFVRQLAGHLELGPPALRLQQDLRQQQAAFQGLDLLAQGLFALRQAL